MIIRLAVILPSGDFKKRRGLINAALSRLEYLEKYPDYEIEKFALKTELREYHFGDLCRGEIECKDILVDGRLIHQLIKIEYHSVNRLFSAMLKLYHKCMRQQICDWEWQKRMAVYCKGNDAILAHSIDAGIVARSASRKYNIPFFVTWHGSEIHSAPNYVPNMSSKVRECIENAACNFFVSEALLISSNRITLKGRKEVLYNGADTFFFKYDKSVVDNLKHSIGTDSKTVVSFIGNLENIKNVLKLPLIFQQIQKKYGHDVCFWIVGDGSQKKSIEEKNIEIGINCTFWGSQSRGRVRDLLNCTDVLVLPSMNEGLPLVCLEALSCGANVVGSKVGGIPEVIGDDFCVELEDSFVDNFANKVVEVLINKPRQVMKSCFDWNVTACKENEIYQKVLNDM